MSRVISHLGHPFNYLDLYLPSVCEHRCRQISVACIGKKRNDILALELIREQESPRDLVRRLRAVGHLSDPVVQFGSAGFSAQDAQVGEQVILLAR